MNAVIGHAVAAALEDHADPEQLKAARALALDAHESAESLLAALTGDDPRSIVHACAWHSLKVKDPAMRGDDLEPSRRAAVDSLLDGDVTTIALSTLAEVGGWQAIRDAFVQGRPGLRCPEERFLLAATYYEGAIPPDQRPELPWADVVRVCDLGLLRRMAERGGPRVWCTAASDGTLLDALVRAAAPKGSAERGAGAAHPALADALAEEALGFMAACLLLEPEMRGELIRREAWRPALAWLAWSSDTVGRVHSRPDGPVDWERRTGLLAWTMAELSARVIHHLLLPSQFSVEGAAAARRAPEAARPAAASFPAFPPEDPRAPGHEHHSARARALAAALLSAQAPGGGLVEVSASALSIFFTYRDSLLKQIAYTTNFLAHTGNIVVYIAHSLSLAGRWERRRAQAALRGRRDMIEFMQERVLDGSENDSLAELLSPILFIADIDGLTKTTADFALSCHKPLPLLVDPLTSHFLDPRRMELRVCSNAAGRRRRPGCLRCELRHSEFSRCSACKQVSYCSAECQKAAWRAHKARCPLLAAAFGAPAPPRPPAP